MELGLREKIKERYGSLAEQVSSQSGNGCCGGASCCGSGDSTSMIYERESLKGLPPAAVTASLGCANPLLFAGLKEGEFVLDLGSGGGIDVLIASRYVGNSGKVYGLDMTDEMLALAKSNQEKMNVKNVEFLQGYIEAIPLSDEAVDAVISNCVINLSTEKQKAVAEAYRVLKKGGRLAVADIVSLKEVPQGIKEMAEAWVGCIAGALSVKEYQEILEAVGFKDIVIEPVHVYTKTVIKDLFKDNQGLFNENLDVDLDLVDGAFAGAQIKALK